MEFIRAIDWDAAQFPRDDGYRGLVLYHGESCAIIASLVPPGVAGPPNHIHPQSDQLYLILDGDVTIRLGSETRKARKHSLIFIPSGVPHHSWNEGDVNEVHLEVISPNALPNIPIVEFVDTEDARGLPYYIRDHDPARFSDAEGFAGFAQDYLLNRASGARHASLYLAQVAPGGAGPSLHTHDFDQFYFVVEGTLNVQIGLEEFAVGPNNLIVLPAGVPHRQWNESDEPEIHAAILVPEPSFEHTAETPWDVGVRLEPGPPIH